MDAPGHPGVPGRRPHPVLLDLHGQRARSGALEGTEAVEGLEERHAEAELVRAEVGGPAVQRLERHVRRRAQHRAGLGDRPADGLGGILLLRLLAVRQAEVHHAHPAVAAHHHVVRLEVAVGDALGVSGDQPFARGEEDLEGGLPARARLLLQPLLEGAAFRELHGEEDAIAREADVVHGDHVGVGELGQRLRFLQQPVLELLAQIRAFEVGAQHLHRDLAIEHRVPRGIDLAHAAGAEPIEDHVAIERFAALDAAGGELGRFALAGDVGVFQPRLGVGPSRGRHRRLAAVLAPARGGGVEVRLGERRASAAPSAGSGPGSSRSRGCGPTIQLALKPRRRRARTPRVRTPMGRYSPRCRLYLWPHGRPVVSAPEERIGASLPRPYSERQETAVLRSRPGTAPALGIQRRSPLHSRCFRCRCPRRT